MTVNTIGVDIAKNVFHVHGVDATGRVVLRRKLRRGQVEAFFADLEPCLIGLEACGSAHHWGRELSALGHDVRLMPPTYVKPYVKRGKNDAVDAEAACEAVGRANMRFVPIKSVEQQAMMVPHRARDLLIRQRTSLVNSVRGQMAEFGIVVGKGRARMAELIAVLRDPEDRRVPEFARQVLLALVELYEGLSEQIGRIDKALVASVRGNAMARRLLAIPGVGPITASAVTALIDDPQRFRNGRHFAAWLGLVARQESTGGTVTLKRISKMGDRYLRRLLVLGATSCMRRAKQGQTKQGQTKQGQTKQGQTKQGQTPLAAWIRQLRERTRSGRKVSVALANKTARHLWVVMATGQPYRPEAAAAPLPAAAAAAAV